MELTVKRFRPGFSLVLWLASCFNLTLSFAQADKGHWIEAYYRLACVAVILVALLVNEIQRVIEVNE